MAKGETEGSALKSGASIEELVKGVLARDRTLIGQALTLVESSQPGDRETSKELLKELAKKADGSIRVGVTGIPGAGKSTFIDSLGKNLTEAGSKVAVLAVDPSSTQSGGSILGDKTRMVNLANHPDAFVRPSPTSGTLGGATRNARESILILEAAGYDVVFLETVGVGQSELAAVDMVDFFVVLVIPGAGDELQGIKRGLVELADAIVVNKVDEQGDPRATAAVRDYTSALRLLRSDYSEEGSGPQVFSASALKNTGLDAIWEKIQKHCEEMQDSGAMQEKRAKQRIKWLWTLAENSLSTSFRNHPKVSGLAAEIESQVSQGQLTPGEGAERFLEVFR